MPKIQTLIEQERGCGFRKPGAFYLIGSSTSFSHCCKLPFKLSVCPCCGSGVKFTRGFQWVQTDLFFPPECAAVDTLKNVIPGLLESLGTSLKAHVFGSCPVSQKGSRIGLMWVGSEFYKTPGQFTREAERLGISKRIARIPKDIRPGSWVALAHKFAVLEGWESKAPDYYTPGVFMLFKVTALQYVVNGMESEKELNEIEANGVDLVKVEREGTQLNLVPGESS